MHFPLPLGFVFEGDKIVLDPDQEVQGAVRMIFSLFEQTGSAFGVVRRFKELALRFPRRAYGGAWDGKLVWGPLIHSRVTSILLNPSYAGVYVFGRYQSSKEIGPAGEIAIRSRRTPQEAWRVMIRDHHQGYIDWDQFTANGARLSANRTNADVLPGPAREGLCLLQGMLVCGVCARRVSVRYKGNGGVYRRRAGGNCCAGVEAETRSMEFNFTTRGYCHLQRTRGLQSACPPSRPRVGRLWPCLRTRGAPSRLLRLYPAFAPTNEIEAVAQRRCILQESKTSAS